MKKREDITLEDIVEAVAEGGRRARRLHKAMGVPIVVWENGQMVVVPPELIVVDARDDRASLQAPE